MDVTAELEGTGSCVETGTSELASGAEGEIDIEPGGATDPELAVMVDESEIVGACEDAGTEASGVAEELICVTADEADCTTLLTGGEESVDAKRYGWVTADETEGASLLAGGGASVDAGGEA